MVWDCFGRFLMPFSFFSQKTSGHPDFEFLCKLSIRARCTKKKTSRKEESSWQKVSLLFLFASVIVHTPTRVTGLGEFSPVGGSFTLSSFFINCRNSQNFGATYFFNG
jgi:hypothetical protein